MIVYHLDKWKYRNVWPPEGTLHADGRWNKAGQWVIYTSPTISLAKLEILANESSLPLQRVCMTIDIARPTIHKLSIKDLPKNWHEKPCPHALSEFTGHFLSLGKLMMEVPSAQSYSESNYLINVRHPDFHDRVKLKNVTEEPFDVRLKN